MTTPHTTDKGLEELAAQSIEAMRHAVICSAQRGGKPGGARKVFALVSGGVDSSAALILALRAGFDVTAVTMRNSDDCAAPSEAAELCSELGIESWVFDLRSEFKKLVVDPFKSAYSGGETPNPCTLCNSSVKFGLLLDRAAQRYGSSDFMVMTGHYSRAVHTPDGTSLLMASDRTKDQSYFLAMLKPEAVSRLLLPLGIFTKADTRAFAASAGLSAGITARIAHKSESMEICFLGESDYRSCIPDGSRPGPIVDTLGQRLGTHSGIINYTVGQRKGLGLTSREPLFVVSIQPETNTVTVGGRDSAMTDRVHASGINILAPDSYRNGAHLTGKIRSQGTPAPCRITITDSSSLTAEFESPQFAPTPGQYLVLYSGDRLVAGGVITKKQ